MRQHQHEFTVEAREQRLFDITGEVRTVLRNTGISQGLVTVFCRHTSCSLIINENADPDVRHDLEAFMKRLVPDGDPAFIQMMLGTWQGIYLSNTGARAMSGGSSCR